MIKAVWTWSGLQIEWVLTRGVVNFNASIAVTSVNIMLIGDGSVPNNGVDTRDSGWSIPTSHGRGDSLLLKGSMSDEMPSVQ